MNKIPSIFFEVTDRCHHHCVFCGKAWRTDTGHSLSYTDLDVILSYPKSLGKITGGEPGLEKAKVFYYVQHETAHMAMNTNLVCWTERELSHLQEKGIHLVLDIPSLFHDEYNQVTGSRNDYDICMRNLNYVNPGNTSISLVITEYTVDTFEKTIDGLRKLGFKNIVASPRIPNGKSHFDYAAALKKIERAYRHYSDIRLLSRTLPSAVPVSHECYAGDGLLVVLSNGDIVPCAWNNHHILGNIRENTYEEIRMRGLAYRQQHDKEMGCLGFWENVRDYGTD